MHKSESQVSPEKKMTIQERIQVLRAVIKSARVEKSFSDDECHLAIDLWAALRVYRQRSKTGKSMRDKELNRAGRFLSAALAFNSFNAADEALNAIESRVYEREQDKVIVEN